MAEIDLKTAPFLYLQEHPGKFHAKVTSQLNKGRNEQRLYTFKPGSKCSVNILKETFFSKQNKKIINNLIIKGVYEYNDGSFCEKFIIPEQNDNHLHMIMENVYDEFAQNLPFEYKEQIMSLNSIVVDKCVNAVIKNIVQKIHYERDKFGPRRIMPAPISTNTHGTKSYTERLPLEREGSNLYDPDEIERMKNIQTIYNAKILPEGTFVYQNPNVDRPSMIIPKMTEMVPELVGNTNFRESYSSLYNETLGSGTESLEDFFEFTVD